MKPAAGARLLKIAKFLYVMSISLGLNWDLCFKSCWDSKLTAQVYSALLLLHIWHGLAALMLPQKYVQMSKQI